MNKTKIIPLEMLEISPLSKFKLKSKQKKS